MPTPDQTDKELRALGLFKQEIISDIPLITTDNPTWSNAEFDPYNDILAARDHLNSKSVEFIQREIERYREAEDTLIRSLYSMAGFQERWKQELGVKLYRLYTQGEAPAPLEGQQLADYCELSLDYRNETDPKGVHAPAIRITYVDHTQWGCTQTTLWEAP